MYTDQEITIRPARKEDLPALWALIFKEEAPEWKRWDAPYFPHQSMSYEKFMETIGEKWVGQEDFWVLASDGTVCGIVSYYFEDAQEKWLEIGIVIHAPSQWNKGMGTRALRLWIDHIFKTLPTVRVGLTT